MVEETGTSMTVKKKQLGREAERGMAVFHCCIAEQEGWTECTRKDKYCQDENKKPRGNRVKQVCLTPVSFALICPLQLYTSRHGN